MFVPDVDQRFVLLIAWCFLLPKVIHILVLFTTYCCPQIVIVHRLMLFIGPSVSQNVFLLSLFFFHVYLIYIHIRGQFTACNVPRPIPDSKEVLPTSQSRCLTLFCHIYKIYFCSVILYLSEIEINKVEKVIKQGHNVPGEGERGRQAGWGEEDGGGTEEGGWRKEGGWGGGSSSRLYKDLTTSKLYCRNVRFIVKKNFQKNIQKLETYVYTYNAL